MARDDPRELRLHRRLRRWELLRRFRPPTRTSWTVARQSAPVSDARRPTLTAGFTLADQAGGGSGDVDCQRSGSRGCPPSNLAKYQLAYLGVQIDKPEFRTRIVYFPRERKLGLEDVNDLSAGYRTFRYRVTTTLLDCPYPPNVNEHNYQLLIGKPRLERNSFGDYRLPVVVNGRDLRVSGSYQFRAVGRISDQSGLILPFGKWQYNSGLDEFPKEQQERLTIDVDLHGEYSACRREVVVIVSAGGRKDVDGGQCALVIRIHTTGTGCDATGAGADRPAWAWNEVQSPRGSTPAAKVRACAAAHPGADGILFYAGDTTAPGYWSTGWSGAPAGYRLLELYGCNAAPCHLDVTTGDMLQTVEAVCRSTPDRGALGLYWGSQEVAQVTPSRLAAVTQALDDCLT